MESLPGLQERNSEGYSSIMPEVLLRNTMISVLLVSSDSDYGALTFEQSDIYSDMQDIFNKCVNNPGWCMTVEIDECALNFEAFKFDDVPDSFLTFLRDEMLDYDDCKHKNFYIVK